MSVEEKLYRCWLGGIGIRETMHAVKRITGAELTFEDVRLRFVELSWRFA